MPLFTAPPDQLFGTGGHLLRGKFPISVWVPFRRELRSSIGQIIVPGVDNVGGGAGGRRVPAANGHLGFPLAAHSIYPPGGVSGTAGDVPGGQISVFRGMPLCSQIGAMLCQGAISGHQLFPERGGFPRHCIAGTPGSLNSVPYLTAPSPAAFMAGPDDHLVTAAGKIFRTYAGVVQRVPIQHQIRKFRQGSLFMVGHSITRNDRNRNRYLVGSRNILSAILVAVQSACLREIRFDWRRGRAGGHRIQIPLGAVRLEAPAAFDDGTVYCSSKRAVNFFQHSSDWSAAFCGDEFSIPVGCDSIGRGSRCGFRSK